ncbi:hypothetical protein CYMTET_3111 [Cymbomonas tetramitiformis]|uniref:CRAL-TRIO domain-containing protein n=1 Tax=Cymbomonas tetramitiformis TaxID=36881 RepID=A0AAE0H5Q5_9CHLO|nr:hypothetical protein CYMTET_3111 [Cymbomonas tetramitiformis]
MRPAPAKRICTCARVMEPIVALLRLTDSDLPTASKVQYHMFEVQEKLKGLDCVDDDLKQELVAIHRHSYCSWPGFLHSEIAIEWKYNRHTDHHAFRLRRAGLEEAFTAALAAEPKAAGDMDWRKRTKECVEAMPATVDARNRSKVHSVLQDERRAPSEPTAHSGRQELRDTEEVTGPAAVFRVAAPRLATELRDTEGVTGPATVFRVAAPRLATELRDTEGVTGPATVFRVAAPRLATELRDTEGVTGPATVFRVAAPRLATELSKPSPDFRSTPEPASRNLLENTAPPTASAAQSMPSALPPSVPSTELLCSPRHSARRGSLTPSASLPIHRHRSTPPKKGTFRSLRKQVSKVLGVSGLIRGKSDSHLTVCTDPTLPPVALEASSSGTASAQSEAVLVETSRSMEEVGSVSADGALKNSQEKAEGGACSRNLLVIEEARPARVVEESARESEPASEDVGELVARNSLTDLRSPVESTTCTAAPPIFEGVGPALASRHSSSTQRYTRPEDITVDGIELEGAGAAESQTSAKLFSSNPPCGAREASDTQTSRPSGSLPRAADQGAEGQLVNNNTIEDPMKYHLQSPLNERKGYVFNLTPKQLEALTELKARAAALGLELERWLVPAGETVDQLALRFLRARGFRLDRALDLLRRDVEWRRNTARLEDLRQLAPEVAAGVDSADSLAKHFATWVQGVDHQGRPVVYKPFGGWRLDELVAKHGATPESLALYLTWATDRVMHNALGEASRTAGCSVEQVVVVLDAAGLRWAWGLSSMQGIALTREMVRLDAEHYPERLGQLFIINVNSVFARGFALVSRILDPVTRDKIRILGTKDVWLPALKEAIGEEQLAEEYGGFNRMSKQL